jgi:hypothetical protein
VELDEGNNAGGEVGEKDLSPAGAYLSWNNLDYSVQIRKGLKKVDLQLLHGVHGYVKPGMMLALMVCVHARTQLWVLSPLPARVLTFGG